MIAQRFVMRFFARPKGLLVLSAVLLLTVFAGIAAGSAKMDAATFFAALVQRDGFETYSTILYSLRIPRVLAAVLAGVGLSVSGAVLQSMTGNALASPNILGINAGAGFCMIALLVLFPQATAISPAVCFVGAVLTAVLILTLADRLPQPKTGVILAGIAVTAVFNAGISLLSLLDTDVLAAYRYFSVGGLDGVKGINELLLPGSMIAASFLLSMLLSTRMDALSLGDATASALGIRTRQLRTVCLLMAAACAAATVSFAGLLGFVGLVVPHLARRLAGNTLRAQLPVCALLGAIMLTLADLIGRTVIAPSELPVGIVTALCGAPFYFRLLLGRAKHAYD